MRSTVGRVVAGLFLAIVALLALGGVSYAQDPSPSPSPETTTTTSAVSTTTTSTFGGSNVTSADTGANLWIPLAVGGAGIAIVLALRRFATAGSSDIT